MPTPSTPTPPDRPEVIEATALGGYLVASSSRPGAFWFVTVEHGRLVCGCERGVVIEHEQGTVGAPRFCRHGRILLAWISANERATARPTAPARPSMFVD